MKKRIIILSFILLLFIVVLLHPAYLTLKGEKVQTIHYKEEYQELGYHAQYFFMDMTDKVEVMNNVDTSTLGTQTIHYKVKGLFYPTIVERVINVVDTEEPVITLKNEQASICPNKEYIPEYQSFDNYDGNITDKVTYERQDNKIIYQVIDSSGNKAELIQKLTIQDIEKPQIKLKGLSTIYLSQGQAYKEPGYETSDNCGKVTVAVTGQVNSNVKGTYTLTYTAIDENNNINSITRTVIVYKPNPSSSGTPGVIYLTFDDGPSNATTEKILDILKEENVKATFFVTGQYGASEKILKREYNEGHTIALHSYSHKYYEIYSSIDAYYDDLYKMQKRVKNVTGYESRIIRFPGGSSNTVSKNYMKGIMSYLSKDVINKGFRYYDWNVDSKDTSCKSSTCVYNSVIQGLSKKRGNYILMHDVKHTTVGALKDIIAYGKANGYKFEAITEQTPMNHHGINN